MGYRQSVMATENQPFEAIEGVLPMTISLQAVYKQFGDPLLSQSGPLQDPYHEPDVYITNIVKAQNNQITTDIHNIHVTR